MCARCKPGPGVGKSPLHQYQITSVNQCMVVDISGPWPMSDNGNEYIIVVGDYYTKYKEAYAVPDHTAMTVADKIVTEYCCRFGIPLQIQTDQGREFESNLFKLVCQKLGITKTKSTPYRPQSQGIIERFNRTLKQMLRIFVNENKSDWDDLLPYLLMAYRSTEHATTGCTPNLLFFGRETLLPIDVMVGPTPESKKEKCPIEYVEWLLSTMNEMYEFVYEHAGKAATRQKTYYNTNLKPRSFEVGTWVWRWYLPEANKKLGLGWVGPYLVVEKLTDLTYTIQKSEDTRRIKVHIDHLKPYEGQDAPLNWLILDEDEIIQDFQDPQEIEEVIPELEQEHRDIAPEPVEEDIPITKPPIFTRRGRLVKPRDVYSP